MKKALIVSPYFPSYGGGGTIRIHNFVKYLSKYGYQPVVLTLKEDYYERIYSTPELLNEYPAIVKIFRTGTLEPKGKNIKEKAFGVKKRSFVDNLFIAILKNTINKLLTPDRTILWLPFAISKGRKIIKDEGIDLIFSTSPPFSSNIVAYLLHKITGRPFIIDYRDDWIGNKYFNASSGYFRFHTSKIMESFLVKRAAKIITVTKDSIALFKRKYPDISNEKYLYISNGYDPEYFGNVPGKLNFLENKWHVNFVYTGSLTRKRDPQYFLRAVKDLVDEDPKLKNKIKVFFLGFTHLQHLELIKYLGLQDIVVLKGNLTPREAADFLQDKADICLIFQRESEGGETSIPGKTYEYLASRKPILCMDDNGATTGLLSELGVGLNTGYEDIESIKNIIKDIINNYDEIIPKYQWSNRILNMYNRENRTGALAEVFDEVIG